jgi:hypothetical protein
VWDRLRQARVPPLVSLLGRATRPAAVLLEAGPGSMPMPGSSHGLGVDKKTNLSSYKARNVALSGLCGAQVPSNVPVRRRISLSRYVDKVI